VWIACARLGRHQRNNQLSAKRSCTTDPRIMRSEASRLISTNQASCPFSERHRGKLVASRIKTCTEAARVGDLGILCRPRRTRGTRWIVRESIDYHRSCRVNRKICPRLKHSAMTSPSLLTVRALEEPSALLLMPTLHRNFRPTDCSYNHSCDNRRALLGKMQE